MRKSAIAASGLLAVAVLAAPAAQADDHEGWYLLAEAAMATPGNTNTALTSSALEWTGSRSGTAESEVVWMEWEDDPAFSIGFGYSMGEKGRIQVSYWDYSGEAEMDGTAGGSGLYTFFNVGPTTSIYYSFYYTFDYDFTQEIDASALDLEFLRTTELNSPVTIDWGVGLRLLSFEDTVDGVYVDSGLPTGHRFPASRRIESDGYGLTGSVGVGYGFGDRFGLSTDMRVGFVISDVDAQSEITDQDGYYHTAGFTHRTSVAGFDDEVAMTIDFNADFTIRFVDAFHLDVGWFFTQWNDLPENQLSRETTEWDLGTFTVTPLRLPGENRDRITWSGPRLAFVWKFGT